MITNLLINIGKYIVIFLTGQFFSSKSEHFHNQHGETQDCHHWPEPGMSFTKKKCSKTKFSMK
jgi:hypothetical protein